MIETVVAFANAFKEAGVIEKYGSGIQRIKDECTIHGVKAPIFEEFDHGLRVGSDRVGSDRVGHWEVIDDK